MLGTLRAGGIQWGAVLLAGVALAAGLLLAASALAVTWDRGFVTRVDLPRYSRVRLPESHPGPVPETFEGLELAQAISESAQEVTPGAQPSATPAAVSPASGPSPAAGRRAAPFIPVEFDILAPGAGSESVSREAITVRKSVRMGAREIGSLPVRVDGDSRLLVEAGEVRDLLARAGAPASFKGTGLISFGELRRAGVDLRYDPNTDSVLLATR